eukprot:CAMPEP_0197005046 /NCGR_PEP_ID=MMETSP1380-20130617/27397_1 /TAXON_ID=5936 /ORGANISM="Euplotes crassus, Strain CT5" /LENGTH=260 /DNA_ID=CAMNT_0042424039 /DNA_START=107 /DNA_END=892 /DNA_ORIENTATION=-
MKMTGVSLELNLLRMETLGDFEDVTAKVKAGEGIVKNGDKALRYEDGKIRWSSSGSTLWSFSLKSDLTTSYYTPNKDKIFIGFERDLHDENRMTSIPVSDPSECFRTSIFLNKSNGRYILGNPNSCMLKKKPYGFSYSRELSDDTQFIIELSPFISDAILSWELVTRQPKGTVREVTTSIQFSIKEKDEVRSETNGKITNSQADYYSKSITSDLKTHFSASVKAEASGGFFGWKAKVSAGSYYSKDTHEHTEEDTGYTTE